MAISFRGFKMKRVYTFSALLILLVTFLSTTQADLSLPQGELVPAYVDQTIELIPSENFIKVQFALTMDTNFIEGEEFSFGIGEAFKVTKAYFDKETILQISQDAESVSIQVGSAEKLQGKILHIEYEGHPQSTSRRKAYVGEDGSYFSWLGGWTPFLPEASGFIGSTTVRVPDNFTVASQGKLISSENKNSQNIFKFKVNQPCYFSLMAAPYEVYSKVVEGIEYRTFFLGGGKQKSDLYISQASKIINAISSQVGPYPYDYLSMIEAPKIEGLRIIGSSEQGMISLGSSNALDDYVNFPIVAHELGHMWFGNWVIGDTSVMSEGLAQLAHFLAAEIIYGEEIMRKEVLYGSPDHFSSLYLYQTLYADSNENEPTMLSSKRDYPTYIVLQGKGPSVFLMLRDRIGKSAFKSGLTSAVKKYAHTRMTMEQLKGELEKSSNQKLDWFFDQWVNKSGSPHLELSWQSSQSSDGYVTTGKITQTNNPYYSMMIELVLLSDKGKSIHTINIQGHETTFELDSDYQPKELMLDPSRKSIWIGNKDKDKGIFSNAMSFQVTHQETIELLRKHLESHKDDLLASAWLSKSLLKTSSESDEIASLLENVIQKAEPHGALEIYYSWATYELAKIEVDKGNSKKAKALLHMLIKLDRTKRHNKQANNLLQKL
jgi:hypothetical protein